MHPSNPMYQQQHALQRAQPQQSAKPSSALQALRSVGNPQSLSRNRNVHNNMNQSVGQKVDASFISPQSIQRMLKEMNLPSKLDHSTTKFYQEVSVLYVRKVFDLAMDYANQRQSTNVEMKDVLRAIKKYSVAPPNEWNHVKLKGSHPLRKNKNKNVAITAHKRRLNIARKSQKIVDKNFNKK